MASNKKDKKDDFWTYGKGGASLPYAGAYKPCNRTHDGTTTIVVVGRDNEPKRYFSGARGSSVNRDYASVVVDLGGGFHAGTYQQAPSGFFLPKDSTYDLSGLAEHEIAIEPPKEVPVARLSWPNMSIPPEEIGVRWWQAFARAFPEESKVVICCIGSHGRTGTALAAILVSFGWTQKDAVKHVRAQHCQRAIESKSQEDYLLDLEDEYAELAK